MYLHYFIDGNDLNFSYLFKNFILYLKFLFLNKFLDSTSAFIFVSQVLSVNFIKSFINISLLAKFFIAAIIIINIIKAKFTTIEAQITV